MSILNVNKINPVGGGSTITIAGIASVTNAVSVGNSVTANAFYGSGANLTGIDATKIETGNTKVETIDTGSDGHIKFTTEGGERLRITSGGSLLVGKTVGTLATAGTRIDPQSTMITGSSTSTNLATASGAALNLINNSATDNNFSNIGGYNSNSLVTSQINFVNTSHSSRTGDITFMTHNGSSMLERLRINNYGLVTAPFQYHLHAQRSNDQTGYDASSGSAFGTPMIFNQIVSETKDSSLSSCFNTSTGVFTAPVLGLYHFCAAAYSSGNSVFSQSWFTLNGSRANGTDWHLTSSNNNFVNNNQVIRLAAGNTVGFKPYASGQTNLTLTANANHTYLKVTLIG